VACTRAVQGQGYLCERRDDQAEEQEGVVDGTFKKKQEWLYICIICMGVVLYLGCTRSRRCEQNKAPTIDTASNDSSPNHTLVRVVY
jgi:hypothetical protein